MVSLTPLPLHVILLVCIFSLAANAQSNDTSEAATTAPQTNVGWVSGPTQRGTLALVHGCLSTIFASTWTVLHLNVPGERDTWWQKALRKAKWMAITVLFPEFVFSKAFYELRTAVADLYDMHVAMKKAKNELRWVETEEETTADFGMRMRLLYRLCGLGTLPETVVDEREQHGREFAPGAANDHRLDGQSKPTSGVRRWKKRHHWTLTHSLYANMGGLAYVDEYPFRRPLTSHALASGVTDMETRDYYTTRCLKGLVLAKDDIEDKSNADWLLKAIAVTQITWLVLNVSARVTAGVPITQLEIATVAFSLMAVATYAANWWKPKDVSKPTILGGLPLAPVSLLAKPHRSFLYLVMTPPWLSYSYVAVGLDRVPNDYICVQHDQTGAPSVLLILLTGSSLVFGGLHCLAWNFEFPSKAEQALWRVASTTSTALSVVSLALVYLATKLSERRYFAPVLDTFSPLQVLPQAWWDLLKERPKFLDWSWQAWFAFRTRLQQHPEDALNWEEEPTDTGTPPLDAEQTACGDQKALSTLWEHLTEFEACWACVRRDGVTGTRGEIPYNHLLHHYGRICGKGGMDDASKELSAQQWRAYEAYLKTKVPDLAADLQKLCLLDFLVDKEQRIDDLLAKWAVSERRSDRVSRFVSISGSIIYAASRLVILVLLFTSLRSVPEGVYQDTPWTRFLPNIS